MLIHSAFHISVWIINRLCQSCCFTCASCLDAAWPAGRKDEQNSDSSRCSKAESHTHRKVIPALQQQLRPGKVLIVPGINQCSLFLERTRRLQEYKHSTELGQTVSSQAERRSLKKTGGGQVRVYLCSSNWLMSCQLCHTLKSEVALEHLHQHGAQTCVQTKFGAVIPGSEENTKCHKYISFFFLVHSWAAAVWQKKRRGI